MRSCPQTMRLLVLLFLCTTAAQELNEFREVYSWITLDFNWQNNTPSGNPSDWILSDVHAWRDRLYVTVLRMATGVPAALASLPVNSDNPSPALDPFPSWDMQTVGNCSALQFARGIEIDTNGKMWVPDSGRISPLWGEVDSRCPHKLLIIDVDSGHVERSIEFEAGLLGENTELATIVVDDNQMAYISDANYADPGILVVNATDGRAWKVRDPSMYHDPSTLEVGGLRVNLSDNVFPLALSPRQRDGSPRRLYYATVTSYELFSVPVDALQTPGTSLSGLVQRHGPTLSPAQAATSDWHGNVYLGLLLEDSVGRWYPSLPFSDSEVLVQDHERLVWVSSLSIDAERNLWVISNNAQNFLAGIINVNSTNYRLIRGFVDTMSYQYSDEAGVAKFRHAS